MTPQDVLYAHEQIAGLTGKMLEAARNGDWIALNRLEIQCAEYARQFEQDGRLPLTGADRQRKVALLKQILANDREIRAITEPWHAQAAQMMQGASGERIAA